MVVTLWVECWPTMKRHKQTLHTMEMRMIKDDHWGVMRLDHMMNEDIWKAFKVAPFPDKMREVKMWWYRHVVRAGEESITRRTLALSPDSWRPQGRWKKAMDWLPAWRYASWSHMPHCRLNWAVGEMQNWPRDMTGIMQRTIRDCNLNIVCKMVEEYMKC